MPSPLDSDESSQLISSRQITGTAVYNLEGERLGSIEYFMIDKVSGAVRLAVLSFGGILGIGQDHYPLPWAALRYDPGQGGYVARLDRDALEHAPRWSNGAPPAFSPNDAILIHDFYGDSYSFSPI